MNRTTSQKNIGCSQYLGLTLPLWRLDLAIQNDEDGYLGKAPSYRLSKVLTVQGSLRIEDV